MRQITEYHRERVAELEKIPYHFVQANRTSSSLQRLNRLRDMSFSGTLQEVLEAGLVYLRAERQRERERLRLAEAAHPP